MNVFAKSAGLIAATLLTVLASCSSPFSPAVERINGLIVPASATSGDVDQNGQRDDLDRHLAKEFGTHAEQHHWAAQVARGLTQMVEVAGSKEKSVAARDMLVVASLCLERQHSTGIQSQAALQAITSQVLNTPARIAAYTATVDAAQAVTASTVIPSDACVIAQRTASSAPAEAR